MSPAAALHKFILLAAPPRRCGATTEADFRLSITRKAGLVCCSTQIVRALLLLVARFSADSAGDGQVLAYPWVLFPFIQHD